MRNSRLSPILVALAVVAAAQCLVAAVSTSAPDVVLQGPAGAPVRFSDYKGKVLLVDFWASWCVPCKTSFPALDAIYREYQPKGLEVLAVNLDEQRRSADAFLAQHPHLMPVLVATKRVAAG